MVFLDWLWVTVYSLVEGGTGWIPVSSLAHLKLISAFWKSPSVLSGDFGAIFREVVGLAAGLAVFTAFFHRLNPVSAYKPLDQKRATWSLWLRILIVAVPTTALDIIFGDQIRNRFDSFLFIGIALVLLGILLLIAEGTRSKKAPDKVRLNAITIPMALLISAAQLLSLLPGVSRTGAALLAALFLGCSRVVAAEFSLFAAFPYLILGNAVRLFWTIFIENRAFTGEEIGVMLLSAAVTYAASLLMIHGFMAFLKKRNLKPVGGYRIVFGALVLVLYYFVIK